MSNLWIRSKNVVWEEVDGGALLVDPATGARWVLNAAAAAVWKLCNGTSVAGESAAFCAALAGAGLLQPAAGLAAESRMSVLGTPSFQALGAGHGARRRPSPGGVSGPV